MHEGLLAALGDASGREITKRLPCTIYHGNPGIEFGQADVLGEGVADVLLIFCADCGGLVRMHRMNAVFVFESDRVSRYGTGGISFSSKPQPRGQA